MAAVSDTTKPMTVALLPGKPETRTPLPALLRKEKQAMQAEDKKLDTPQKQSQSSTVVNISAKARELNSTAPVDQTSSAVKTGSSTDKAANVTAKDTEANRTAPVAQPPSAVNTGSPATPTKKA
ncbi:MAG: hypothetical protein PHD65_08315 [Gallionella sp.]|nr:hypothetical protein [Gallionella sp.]